MSVTAPSPRSRSDLVWRGGGFSLRVKRRMLLACLGLTLLCLAISAASLTLGDYPLSAAELLAALRGEGEGAFVLGALRAPRLLTGLLAGACFGLSGAMFQSLARNPLASPDVIGFTQGAGLGAVVVIVSRGAQGLWLTAGAAAGGLAAAAAVAALSWKDGLRIWRLVLVGVAMGFSLYAGIDFLLTRTDIFAAQAATQWLTGSLNARLWLHVAIAGGGLLVLGPAALACGRGLERLEMGEDMAAGLGTRVGAARIAAAVVAVLLAAVAVSVCGPVAFVALVSGPLGRRIADASGPALLPAALTGAALLAAADLAGRVALPSVQLPAGVFTAVLGAPYLLWLLAVQIRKGAL